MHFSKLTAASLLALVASLSTVSASPADGAYAGGFPAGGYGSPAPVANAAAPAPAAPAAGAPAPAPAPAASSPAAGAPAPVATPPVANPAPVPATPSASPVPPAAPATGKVWTVMVGNGNFTFIPRNFMASVGDTVSFVWTVGTHTVTQSTKADLCTKKADPAAFASGSHGAPFTWNITINSTDPLWYYCGLPTHCQKGMYAAINFPLDQPFPTLTGSGNGTAGNSTGNGTSAEAGKTNAASSLTTMSTSALLAGALAVGAFLL
jgi:plastocyanin